MEAFLTPLSQNEEKDCLDRLKNGDKSAKDELVLRNMRLVAHVARKYQSGEEEIEDLLLYDISGVLVYQTTPTTNQYTLDVSELKNGIYILHAETKSGVYRNKIIKE